VIFGKPAKIANIKSASFAAPIQYRDWANALRTLTAAVIEPRKMHKIARADMTYARNSSVMQLLATCAACCAPRLFSHLFSPSERALAVGSLIFFILCERSQV